MFSRRSQSKVSPQIRELSFPPCLHSAQVCSKLCFWWKISARYSFTIMRPRNMSIYIQSHELCWLLEAHETSCHCLRGESCAHLTLTYELIWRMNRREAVTVVYQDMRKTARSLHSMMLSLLMLAGNGERKTGSSLEVDCQHICWFTATTFPW